MRQQIWHVGKQRRVAVLRSAHHDTVPRIVTIGDDQIQQTIQVRGIGAEHFSVGIVGVPLQGFEDPQERVLAGGALLPGRGEGVCLARHDGDLVPIGCGGRARSRQAGIRLNQVLPWESVLGEMVHVASLRGLYHHELQ
ncbi:hypothetical protein D3C71_1207710 [compost metagenome]